jgi:hypothetical protein
VKRAAARPAGRTNQMKRQNQFSQSCWQDAGSTLEKTKLQNLK